MKPLIFAALAFVAAAALAAPVPQDSPSQPSAAAVDFGAESPSREAREIALWTVRKADHKGLPFAIVDKLNARLYAFDGRGQFMKATPVLIGMGVGDVFPPGVAKMDMYQTKPWQRMTPAGRFEADVFEKGKGKSTVWVDYDSGIALHKMPEKKTAQRRAERMVSTNPADHRITYGCINVPPAFYDAVIYPAFKANGGIVYVLPDKLPLETAFKGYGVGERLHLRQTEYVAR